RSKPLVPTSTPFTVLDKFRHSARWYFNDRHRYTTEDETRMANELDDQAGRLLKSVLRFAEDPCGSVEYEDRERAGRRKTLSSLRIEWNNQGCQYTFVDGSTLPQLHYVQQLWK